MNKEKLIEHIESGKSTYDIAKAMNCGQTSVRYWLKKYGLKTKLATIIDTDGRICKKCGNNLKGRQTIFCSKKCKASEWDSNTKNTSSGWRGTQQRGVLNKTKHVIENNGCKCCKYKKNIAALTFHHRNPNEKSYEVSMRFMGSRDIKKVEEEIQKCDLLCVNCHMETESPNLMINENANVKHFATTTGFNRKIELLDRVGHLCSVCGYNKNYRALTFHHLNPATKSFNLDINTCQKKPMNLLLEEASKCVVLCGNCHAEEHYPHLNLE